VDINWLMFYPSVFVFSIWQAYNHARFFNHLHTKEEKEDPIRPEYTYMSFGWVVGANFGIYYPFLVSPLFSGIGFGLVLGIIADKIEKYMIVRMEERNENR
jgi:hypothetical protein